MENVQEVWIISGVPAAGKTNTSKALARTFDRAAVIRRDELQAQIISGNVWPDGRPASEADSALLEELQVKMKHNQTGREIPQRNRLVDHVHRLQHVKVCLCWQC